MESPTANKSSGRDSYASSAIPEQPDYVVRTLIISLQLPLLPLTLPLSSLSAILPPAHASAWSPAPQKAHVVIAPAMVH